MMSREQRAGIVLHRLRQAYPRVESALRWKGPWELLVATVLSAQCTDEQVNRVTPALFSRWPGVEDLAEADPRELEQVIRSTGLFRNKARHLVMAARQLRDRFQGQVPDRMEDLVSLPGIARKTANIVLSNGFGRHEGIAVDTHVKRLAYRLGLTEATAPQAVERDLIPLFPRQAWGQINHLLVWFGRDVCRARSPLCPDCRLMDICPRQGL
jgi:endonuclease-3